MSAETKRSHSYCVDKHGVVACKNCGAPPKCTNSCQKSSERPRIIDYHVFDNDIQQPLLMPTMGIHNTASIRIQ